MNATRLIYTFLFILTFSSCINMTDPKRQAEYIEYRNSFDTSLVGHIPTKIPNNMINMGYASLEYLQEPEDYAGMHITIKIGDNESYKKQKEEYQKKALYIKSSLDSNLLVINTYGELESGISRIRETELMLPVPQYAIYSADDSTQIWKRNTNEEIIILDYSFKDLLKRDDSNRRTDLPLKYSRGYSTGITFNNKELTIKYWMIVW